MSDWQERKTKSKREIESGKFLRELLNAPSLDTKKAIVAQYNPLHYVLISNSLTNGESHGIPQ
jgi:hypothetical protein